jgi:hypothetical protein
MAIIRLPGPSENAFEGSPFAESFSSFLLEQGISGIDPGNVGQQGTAFRQSLAPPAPVARRTAFGGNVIASDQRAASSQTPEGILGEELSGLLRGVAARSGESDAEFRARAKTTRGGRLSRITVGAGPSAFDELFQAGLGEFSSRLRGTRATPGTFQVKGGRRTGREDFV